jgi:CRISPR-associated protein Csm4
MSKTIIYKLSPRGPFHIGGSGIGIEKTWEFIHSDTLFSAIVSAWRSLGEKMDSDGNMELLEPFFSQSSNLPFRLSSAFPYACNVLLYPAPKIKSGTDKEERKAQFVSSMILRSGKIGGIPKQSSKVYVDECEKNCVPDVIWKSGYSAIVPRVTIDRINSASAIYHCGEVVFSDDCGLYFWVELIDESYENHLNRAIEFLSEAGIGGERSIGCGQFTYSKPESISLPIVDDPNMDMTLSLYHPTCHEVKAGVLDGSAYELVNRRGWLRSPDGGAQRRKSVKMLSEGSVFSQSSFVGDISDVKPDEWKPHPIYEYGLAFKLPIRWGGEESA